MYLKRLDIQGFKSFPNKITLEFGKGITAVVGPNGSGKSNISDAVRWVLGEQSIKSLRGSKMEDIIFSGTENKRLLSFAEVALVLDNSDRKIALEFDEISVKRRVFRSGQSNYYINNSECRLKDVHELFMDTGIGRDGYSIIGQGKIDEILSVKSEDRRQLFEEAAGIMKYKHRRNETLQKLEREKQNLIRITDIISELELQLEPLFMQSEKAKSFISLSEKLKLYEINVFIYEVNRSEDQMVQIEANIQNTNIDLQTEEENQNTNIEKTEELKQKLVESESSIDENNKKINQNRIDKEKIESEISLLKQQRQHNDENIKKADEDINAKHELILAYDTTIENSDKQHLSTLHEKESKEQELAAKSIEYDELSGYLQSVEEQLTDFNQKHITLLSKKAESESEISKNELLYQQMGESLEKLSDDKQENEFSIAESKTSFDECLMSYRNIDNEIENIQAKKEILSNERTKFESQYTELNDKLIQNNKLHDEAVSKHKLLEQMESNYDGYYTSVKAVLNQKKRGLLNGILGSVAELVAVDTKYETAIDIALGASLQNIITETENDAQEAIEYLKKAKMGRATFLPLTSIKPSEKFNLPKHVGVLGIASDLIRYDKSIYKVISHLLGRTIVMDNIKNAVDFSRSCGYKYRIVTLEGDMISSTGSMSGGSVNKGQSAIISRSREIIELKTKIEQINADIEKFNISINDILPKLEAVTNELNKNNFRIHEFEVKKASLSTELEQKKKQANEYILHKEKLTILETELMQKIIIKNSEIRANKAALNEISVSIDQLLTTSREAQSDIFSKKDKLDIANNELTSIKIELSKLEMTVASVMDNVKKIITDKEKALADINKLTDDARNLERANMEINEKIAVYENDSEILDNEFDVNSVLSVTLKNNREDFLSKISESEKSSIDRIKTISNLSNELNRLNLYKEQFTQEIRKLYDTMWEDHKLTYQEALKCERPDMTKTVMDREIKSIKNEISGLGSVNVSAIDEYKQVLGRYEFMSTQKKDIISAEEKLKDIILELKNLMEKQFSEQFTTISEHFNEVFSEIFGGGKAYLRLTDEDDVLESGIEIIAQMPGKTLQNMMLFSGGERALTAIALLFAILKIKPSPFCVLDEIEAALDDANVKRFAGYLKRLSELSQFIVITHRKGTMEAADIMYGVTMQEQGISKLVSVNFTSK